MVGVLVPPVVLLPSAGEVVEVGLGVTVPYKPDKAASKPIWPVVDVGELVLACTRGEHVGISMLGILPVSPCTDFAASGTKVASVGAVLVGLLLPPLDVVDPPLG